MLMRNHSIVLLFSILLIMIFGCQGKGDPTVPGADPGLQLSNPREQATNDGYDFVKGHQLIAILDCQIDWENQEVDWTLLRTAGQHLNLLVLIPIYCSPPSACLDFQNIEIDYDNLIVELDVIVNHPIPDSYADVFDMRGIGIFKSNEDPGFSDGPIATQILNADGYTTAYDSDDDFYDAFLNPYLAFNKDEDNRIFENKTTSIEHIICQFPSFEPDDSKFLYALDATWSDPLYYDPEDPLTDPNMAEPYEVQILHVDSMSDEYLSEGTVIVQVFDWQANARTCELEAPAFLGGSYEMTEVWSADGRYMYYYNIINDLEAAEGWYKFLVKANDEYETMEDLVDPTIVLELSNYQLGTIGIYDSTANTAPVVSVVTSETVIQPFMAVQFDASSSFDAEDGDVQVFAWDFDGDGQFDDSGAPEVDWIYNDLGTYAVNVVGTDSSGLSDVLDSPIIINVTPITNTPPIAEAEASNMSPLVGEEITLDGSASSDIEDGKPVSWDWDLDNDEVFGDETGEIINYTWDTAGVYFVDLLVKDSGNLGDTLTDKLVIEVLEDTNQPPVASAFSSHISAVVGEEVTFDGTASTDPEDGLPVQWFWDIYGDETYQDAQGDVIVHQFWSPGTYDIDLKVFDSRGLWDVLDEKISIEITGEANTLPVAVATADKDVVVQYESIHFDATDSYDEEDGEIEIFAWDLDGDGSYFESFSGEFDYFYPEIGFYMVNVRVTDSRGASDILEIPIAIQVSPGDNTPPTAVAVPDQYFIIEGGSVTFDGADSYDLEDGIPVSWEWDLDDDDEFDDSPFVLTIKQFDIPGEYLIDLKVTDSGGLWDTLDEELLITVLATGSNFPPEAIADVNCTFPMVGQTVYLTDSSFDSDGEVVLWEWDFGDGEGWQDFTSTEGDATFVPELDGPYFMNLRVTDDEGVSDVLNSMINVTAINPPFEIPSGEPFCTQSETHMMGGSTPLEKLNTSLESRDITFLMNGTFLMVVSDKLYQLFPPSFPIEPPLMDEAGWIRSMDSHSNGLVALSNLDDGIVHVYMAMGEMEIILDPMLEIDTGGPIQAVTFDVFGNIWVYQSGTLSRYSQPSFQPNSCFAFNVDEIEALGVVNDMDYSPWNHSMFIAIADGANGTVAWVDHVGDVSGTITDVLLGPTDYIDIVCDKNVVVAAEAGCRIAVAGGTDTTYMTRLDANLEILDQKSFGYWGTRSIALDMGISNTILGLESCCLGWVDLFVPPFDWMDFEE